MPKDNSPRDRENNPLWKRFAGQPLDDVHLKERAVALSPLLMGHADESSIFLRDKFYGDLHHNLLFWETMILLLHLVDRISFECLGEEKRNLFMDPLVRDIADRFAETIEEKSEQPDMKQQFLALYNTRIQEYMTGGVAAPKGDEGDAGIENTVGWKFAYILNGGEVAETNSAMPLIVEKFNAGLLKILHLKDLLKG
jgi:hypothetical protein